MKKTIINYLIILLATAGHFSCSDRYKALAELDQAPEVKFKIGDSSYTTLRDSVKLYPNNFYNLQLSLDDINKNIQKLSFESTPSTSKYFVGQVEYTNSLPVDFNIYHLNILPTKLGLEHIVFTVTDRFNKTGTAELDLVCFANLPPVSKFIVTEKRQNDPLEFELDGSESFDKDYRFGGQIAEYKWVINNTYTVSSLAPKIRYIFPQQGLFKIDLIVKDNEGAVTSLTKYETIN